LFAVLQIFTFYYYFFFRCLTGNQFKAAEAEKAGLVSKVLPQAELVPAALKLAEQIAEMSQPIVALCKEAVNTSEFFSSSLRLA